MNNFLQGLMNYHFVQNALISSVLIGAVAGMIGCFIILRGMSLMGDAISHAVLPGVALSYIVGVNFFFGALAFGLLASFIIAFINRNSVVKSDTAIGITFSSFLALGIILIGVAKSSTDLFHILFGNILAVQDFDLLITVIVGIFVFVTIISYFKELQVTSFDPVFARSAGLLIDVSFSISFDYSNAKCRNSYDCSVTDYTSSNSVFIFEEFKNDVSLISNVWLTLFNCWISSRLYV